MAAALSIMLMLIILVLVATYVRKSGAEDLL
jgi:spermidine/putrescine transport system permease protein